MLTHCFNSFQWSFYYSGILAIDFVFHMLNEWDDREKTTTRVGALTSLSTSIKWWQLSNNPLSRYHPKEHIIICLHSKHLIRDAIQWHEIRLLNNIFYIYFSLWIRNSKCIFNYFNPYTLINVRNVGKNI